MHFLKSQTDIIFVVINPSMSYTTKELHLNSIAV